MTENALLDAVDALTKPYKVTVRDIHGNPATDDGKPITNQQPARLHQLKAAIHPSGNTGSNGSNRAERNLIDAGALEQWSQYRDQINAAARKLDVTPDDDPAVTLRRWYVAAKQRTLTDSFEQEWERRFTEWARAIDRRLNPPYQREIVRPCPFCGEQKAIDPVSQTIVTAVVAETWRDEQAADTSWFIRCRFCGASGYSLTEIREWAYGIEQAEQEATG